MMKRLGFLALSLFLIVFLFLIVGVILLYSKQDSIVQSQLEVVNEGFQGEVELGDSHLAIFEKFPYVSLKVDDVRVREFKKEESSVILDVADIYVGFQFWDILSGNYDIKSLVVEDGFFDIVLHEDGTTNIQNALQVASKADTTSSIVNIHLRQIELRNIEIHQREEATNLDISTTINSALGAFESAEEQIMSHVDSDFILDVVKDGDTTYFNNKHFEFHTDLTFDKLTGLLSFKPSGIVMEHGDFELEGSIDTKNQMTLDIEVKGTKPSFDMFIAFAPSEIVPVLERYDNAGDIYFNALLKGPTTDGQQPLVEANFGASEAFLENKEVDKRIDHMGFSGYFTNGSKRDLSTMKFSMKDISANLEEGEFLGALTVTNFQEPEIEMNLDADFDLGFWAAFLNLRDVQDLDGRVELHMKFHDVIDLDDPTTALENLNQAYYAKLDINDFSVSAEALPAPLTDLDLHLEMEGKEAILEKLNMVMGNSDIHIEGTLSDLPVIVHHAPTPVHSHLEISANLLDIEELSKYSEADSTGVKEKIKDLRLAFSFDALGNSFTEFIYLPIGEFFVDDLHADIQNYPHSLHDFHADVLIKEDDLKIIDFTGNIDSTDFHFNGLIRHYSALMKEELHGEVGVDVTLKSDLFRLEDVFTYNGVNYVPPDYRHEEIETLELHALTTVTFDSSKVSSLDVQLDKWEGKMHIHPMRFDDFSGNFQFDDERIRVSDFKGTLGKSSFDIDLEYYSNTDSTQNEQSTFSIQSGFIDFDELFSFQLEQNSKPTDTTDIRTDEDVEEHAEAFNIFEIPFANMKVEADIGQLNYQHHRLANLIAEIRMTKDHFLYLDTMRFDAAGGNFAMKGYLNGSDPEHIYLKPNLVLTDVNLDEFFIKFENFGQDQLVSDNIHGRLTAHVWGNIRIYPDLVPDLDQSEVHLDAAIFNGRLENFDPILMLSDYFGDKDLTRVRFDTIQNHMDFQDGTLNIPSMTIESTLGHMEIEGSHDKDNSMDYHLKIPWSLVKQAAKNKLFGAKRKDDAMEDKIVEVDKTRNTRFLNVYVTGNVDDFDVKLRKPKKK